MKVSNFEIQYPEKIKIIFDIYSKYHHSNISNYLKNTNKLKNIIYSYSNIHEDIEIINFEGENEIINKKINGNNLKINKQSIIKQIVLSFKSENDFEMLLKDFYN